MKRILSELKSHLKEDFHFGRYSLIISFLATLIFCNYYFRVEGRVLAKLSNIEYLLYFLTLYTSVYYISVFIKSGKRVFSKAFIATSGLFIIGLSLSSGFIFYREWVEGFGLYEKFYLRNIIANSQGLVWVFVPMLVAWFASEKRFQNNFYGFSIRNHDFRPYLILLALMIPLLLAAGTQSDFLASYPTFKVWKYQEVFGLSHSQMMWIYECFYLSDFIRVEALFRGALVIGLARFLGKDSIICMATIYCVIHFNKPLGETISSFFGGYLLGTIAYYQKNIVGGCIVHAGIAGLMEVIAYVIHTT